MTPDTLNETIAALDELLESERDALLQGDLDQIARLYERKSGLIDTLAQLDRADEAALNALNEKVLRNQELLDQAAAGIRAVAQRLAALRQVRTSLDTYTERGARRSIDMNAEGSVEKRA